MKEIILVAKRGFAYSYYDVQVGIYPKMNEIHSVVLEFDEIMNANNNETTRTTRTKINYIS